MNRVRAHDKSFSESTDTALNSDAPGPIAIPLFEFRNHICSGKEECHIS